LRKPHILSSHQVNQGTQSPRIPHIRDIRKNAMAAAKLQSLSHCSSHYLSLRPFLL
jgi:hypothetical protein